MLTPEQQYAATVLFQSRPISEVVDLSFSESQWEEVLSDADAPFEVLVAVAQTVIRHSYWTVPDIPWTAALAARVRGCPIAVKAQCARWEGLRAAFVASCVL
jgi:hypothetical protein